MSSTPAADAAHEINRRLAEGEPVDPGEAIAAVVAFVHEAQHGDPTEQIRRDMIASAQPHRDLAVTVMTCSICGSTADHGDADHTPVSGQIWDTDQLQADFEVQSFCAPFVVVKRRSDGARGTLEFTHRPRVYFDFREAGT